MDPLPDPPAAKNSGADESAPAPAPAPAPTPNPSRKRTKSAKRSAPESPEACDESEQPVAKAAAVENNPDDARDSADFEDPEMMQDL